MDDAAVPTRAEYAAADLPTALPAVFAATGRFYEKTDWRSFMLTAGLLLAVYLWTLAPDVTLENSGIFATGACYAGVPDCPGYPVWTIYSWLFTWLLPSSTIAWRVAVGSALEGAAASGLVAVMVSRGGKLIYEGTPVFSRWNEQDRNRVRIVCGCIAGLALGLSEPVWRKAVVVDVWTFGLLLFACLLSLLMRWLAEPEKRRYLYRACLILGILMTGNWELMLLVPALFLVVAIGNSKISRDLFIGAALIASLGWLAVKSGYEIPLGNVGQDPIVKWFELILLFPAAVVASASIIKTRRPGSEWKVASRCLLWLFAGLGCFLYLPVASMMDPPVNWAYPRTVEGFFHCVNRGQYESLHPVANISTFCSQLWVVLKDTSSAFGRYYLPFALLPFLGLGHANPVARKWMFGLVLLFIFVGPILIAVLNPDLPGERQSEKYYRPYWTAMYAILALWSGLGMIALAGWVARPAPTSICQARP